MKREYKRNPIKNGNIYLTNNFGEVEVINYVDYKNIEVRFLSSGSTTWVRGGHLKDGNIRDTYQPTLFGVGVVGNVPTTLNGKLTPVYNYWCGVLERCYSEKLHNRFPTYQGCTVQKSWLHLEVFKVWFDANYREGWEIDKDLLFKSNKHYSEDTCRFIPKSLNNLIKENRRLKKSKLPLGVTYSKDCTHNPYSAAVCTKDGRISLGNFSTKEAAFIAYKTEKLKRIHEVAQELWDKGDIDYPLFCALKSWEILPYE